MGRLRLSSLVLSVAAVAVAAPTFAADLPVAPAYNPPPAYLPHIYDWTGLYLGVNVGAGVLEDSVTQTTATALFNAGSQTHVNAFSVLGGGQVGVNYEFAPWVVGIEGTFTSAYLSGGNNASTLLSASNAITERPTSAEHWYATATGRLGYAFNDLLLYGKGGAAWMHATYTQDILLGNINVGSQGISDTRMGFVVGAGAEYGISENLSLKVEYDFLDFGSKTYNFSGLAGAASGLVPTGPIVGIKADTQIFTVGVNYRFNWGGGGPVVAAGY